MEAHEASVSKEREGACLLLLHFLSGADALELVFGAVVIEGELGSKLLDFVWTL